MDADCHRSFVRRGIVTGECLGYFLGTSAGYWPDRELISFGEARYSYGEMHRWATAAAQDLHRRGIVPGDKILIQAVNSIELLVLQFAVWRLGAITVPVVPMYRRHELTSIIRDTHPRAIASSGKIGNRCYCTEIEDMLAETGMEVGLKLVLEADAYRPGWSPLAPPPAAAAGVSEQGLPEPAGAEECAVILYTSGSTAAPKGAQLASGAIVNNGRAMQKVLGISENDVALCATPLGHTSAVLMSLILPMIAGGRTTVLGTWKPDEAVRLIEREGVTFMGAPPLILQDLIERYENAPPGAYRIRKLYGGGGAISPALIRRAEGVGIKASRNYGMTETTGSFSMCHHELPLEHRAAFDGHPFYGSEAEIVDDERRPVPIGSVGEIRVRGPLNMIGYLNPEHNAAAVDAQGWFYTGDLGALDAAGGIIVKGRVKDIINRGGEKFACQDIEAAIALCSDVLSVAVVGAPDPRYGEVVAAFIRLRPGVEWTGPERIIAHLEHAKLAKPKRPVQWHVLDEFPRTPSGKIQKQELRKLLLQV